MKLLIIICTVLMQSSVMACESGNFRIYYLDLEIEFYLPPDRDYIMKYGLNLELDGCEFINLFKAVVSQKGLEPQDQEHKSLRIMIVNKADDREVFITSEKKIIYMNKKYDVKSEIIDGVLKKIIEAAQKLQ